MFEVSNVQVIDNYTIISPNEIKDLFGYAIKKVSYCLII